MRRKVFVLIASLGFILVLSVGMLAALPRLLPLVISSFIPPNTSLVLGKVEVHAGYLTLPSIVLSSEHCEIINVKHLVANYRFPVLYLHASSLAVDTNCLPDEESKSSELSSLKDLVALLSKLNVTIDRVSVNHWKHYSGKLTIKSKDGFQLLDYTAPAFNVRASLKDHQLELNHFYFEDHLQYLQLTLSGRLELARWLNQLPTTGELKGKVYLTNYRQATTLNFNWSDDKGHFILADKEEQNLFVSLPWQIKNKSLVIHHGVWHWPYDAVPISGGFDLVIKPEGDNWNKANIEARLNILTKNTQGKGNLVMSFGPGQIGFITSNLAFMLEGQTNIGNLIIYSKLPGQITGPILDPLLKLHSSALVRAKGVLANATVLDEVRLPLAGLTLGLKGINGRLQAIANIHDPYWGRVRLHLDGQATNFMPDRGKWSWKFWGDGLSPIFKAHWDLRGHGNWHNTRISIDRLSTGFNQLLYRGVKIDTPRLVAVTPIVWQRNVNSTSLRGKLALHAEKTEIKGAGNLPPSLMTLNLYGKDLTNFQWKGELQANPIGPIDLNGRWDGRQLRGSMWWPKQPLSVLQSLLPQKSDWRIQQGEIQAQLAFSSNLKQGLVAGGHWNIKNGKLRLGNIDLNGLDFVMPIRLGAEGWLLGSRGPITLRIQELNNLFKIENLQANLQGYYPFSAQKPLHLTKVSLNILNGTINMDNLTLPQRKPALLQLHDLSLSELITALKPKQIAMSGLINGELPIYLNPQSKWLVKDGWITNNGYLTSRIDPDFLAAIRKDNIAAGAILDWLSYIEINSLKSNIDVNSQGLFTLDAQVQGINVKRNSRQQINLNYQHTENILMLWHSLQFGSNLAEDLADALGGSINEQSKK